MSLVNIEVSKVKNIISSLLKGRIISVNFVDYFHNNYFSYNQDIYNNNKFFFPNISINNDSKNLNDKLCQLRPAIDLGCCYALFHDYDKYQNDLQYSSYPDIHNNFEKVRVLMLGAKLYFGFFYNITNNIKDHIFYCSEIDLLPIIILDSFYPDLFNKEKKEYISNFRDRKSVV